MAKDSVYTNGVIAVRETRLLGDKLVKLCETNAEEAFRVVTESGFGKGAEAVSVYDYENLLVADERDTDSFIREYAPSEAVKAYLLAPRDFHNAKALMKAHYLGVDPEKMLAPKGLVEPEKIAACAEEENYKPLGGELASACEKAAEIFAAEGGASGAEIGIVFEKALYRYLSAACAKSKTLKKFVAMKADMTNILSVMRAGSYEIAERNFVDGGALKRESLRALTEGEKAAQTFLGTDYSEFVNLCQEAKSLKQPYMRAEILRDNLEINSLAARKFDLKRSEPFLYYVFRRRAENANVRILFVCLLAGMDEGSIRKRLRTF